MSVAIIVFPGSNCDRDLYRAVKKTIGIKPEMLWHSEKQLPDHIKVVFLPGGFAYGDYIRAGAIAANTNIMKDIYKKSIKQQIYVIGICNGFQILTECNLLDGSLLQNGSLQYRSLTVGLQIDNRNTIISSAFDKNYCHLPLAHKEGKYYATPDTLKKLQDNDNIIFRYQQNPNGALDNIASIKNDAGNVFGIMPHPERAVDKYSNNTDGIAFFQSVLEYLS